MVGCYLFQRIEKISINSSEKAVFDHCKHYERDIQHYFTNSELFALPFYFPVVLTKQIMFNFDEHKILNSFTSGKT